jgi:hypothetical protein
MRRPTFPDEVVLRGLHTLARLADAPISAKEIAGYMRLQPIEVLRQLAVLEGERLARRISDNGEEAWAPWDGPGAPLPIVVGLPSLKKAGE